MAREFSPEERLLNLIKRRKTRTKEGLDKRPSVPPQEPIDYKQKINTALSSVSGLNNAIHLKNIKILNTFFFAILVIIIIYFVIEIFLIPAEEPALPDVIKPDKPHVPEEIMAEPYSYYSKELKAKEVFKPLVKEEIRESIPEIPIEELIGNLALLGIVAGENPQAIIEDKKQQKTFFLREGESAGGILLKKIADGTVTVIYKGEEFNLTL